MCKVHLNFRVAIIESARVGVQCTFSRARVIPLCLSESRNKARRTTEMAKKYANLAKQDPGRARMSS